MSSVKLILAGLGLLLCTVITAALGTDVHGSTRRSAASANSTEPKPELVQVPLHDSNPSAQVLWLHKDSDVLLVLTIKSKLSRSTTATNNLYISRDYGRTLTLQVLYTQNGIPAEVSSIHKHSVKNWLIIVDSKNQNLFVSTDDARSFVPVAMGVPIDTVHFHPSSPEVVALMSERNLYISSDRGMTWRQRAYAVEKFFWLGDGSVPEMAEFQDLSNRAYFVVQTRIISSSSVCSVILFNAYSEAAKILLGTANYIDVVNNFMIASVYNDTSGKNELLVAPPGKNFAAAKIPLAHMEAELFRLSEVAEDGQAFIVATANGQSDLLISDASGLRFTRSLERILYFDRKIHRRPGYTSADLLVDMSPVKGLHGVYIASSVNQEGFITTLISFDFGARWTTIKPPERNLEGQQFPGCSQVNCSLHLYIEFGSFNQFFSIPSMLSTESAPGLLIAAGMIGDNLRKKTDIFMSSNGGLSWKQILTGRWLYALLDHGSVIVAVEHAVLSQRLLYSLDEASTWSPFEFSSVPLIIYGMLTEPGEKTTVVSLFGSSTEEHSWIIIQVNFSSVLGAPCSAKDYEVWIPSNENKTHCLLGKKLEIERKSPKSVCYNGMDFVRMKEFSTCECTLEDYDCDYSYILQDGVCKPDPEFSSAVSNVIGTCPEGHTYNVTRGYTKIPGDTCRNGVSSSVEPVLMSCPASAYESFLVVSTRSQIKKVILPIATDTSFTYEIPSMHAAVSVDYDLDHNCLFWSDIVTPAIHRLCLGQPGGVQTLMMGRTKQILFDWIGRNIFYLGDSPDDVVGIVNVDNHHSTILIKCSDCQDVPSLMALNSNLGLIYWVVGKDLHRSSMDGSNGAVIYRSQNALKALSIDSDGSSLYWMDGGTVTKANLDGTDIQKLQSIGNEHPVQSAVFNNQIYLLDWSSSQLSIYNLQGFQRQQSLLISGTIAISLVTRKTRKAPTTTPSCEFLKVPRIQGDTTCLCPHTGTPLNSGEKLHCVCPGREVFRNGLCIFEDCPSGWLPCSDGRCLPKSKFCNGQPECSDGSDEEGCSTTCNQDEFRCRNQLCIKSMFVCDYEDDCGDSSDEDQCEKHVCASGMFQCPGGKCITMESRCDGIEDCLGGNDEFNCDQDKPVTCSIDQFRCMDGRCLARSLVCDGIRHCSDDELNCGSCSGESFQCTSRQCVLAKYMCDNIADCPDGSDESSCVSKCVQKPKTCNNSRCLPASDFCNGLEDCPMGEDETDCDYLTPPTSKPVVCNDFRCWNGLCIPMSMKCNGIDNCKDNSDELNCQGRSSCLPSDWWCEADRTCLHNSTICNGFPDCSDRTDESQCHYKNACSPPFGYQCSDGQACLSPDDECNIQTDCGDESDEKECDLTVRVTSIEVVQTNTSAEVSWNFSSPGEVTAVFLKEESSDPQSSSQTTIIPLFSNQKAVFSGLMPCTVYILSVASRKPPSNRLLHSTKLLYTKRVYLPPKNLVLDQDTSNGFLLRWTSLRSNCPDPHYFISCTFTSGSHKLFAEFSDTESILLSKSLAGWICNVASCPWRAYNPSCSSVSLAIVLVDTGFLKRTLTWVIPVVVVLGIGLLAVGFAVYRSMRRRTDYLSMQFRRHNRTDSDEDLIAISGGDSADSELRGFSADDPLLLV